MVNIYTRCNLYFLASDIIKLADLVQSTETTTGFRIGTLGTLDGSSWQKIEATASSTDPLCTNTETATVYSNGTYLEFSSLEPGCAYNIAFQTSCFGQNSASAPSAVYCTSKGSILSL